MCVQEKHPLLYAHLGDGEMVLTGKARGRLKWLGGAVLPLKAGRRQVEAEKNRRVSMEVSLERK